MIRSLLERVIAVPRSKNSLIVSLCIIIILWIAKGGLVMWTKDAIDWLGIFGKGHDEGFSDEEVEWEKDFICGATCDLAGYAVGSDEWLACVERCKAGN